MTVPGPIPAWAQSVDAFSSAMNNSPAVSTAAQIQFPQTDQLGGLCDNLVNSTSMGSGLLQGGVIGGNTTGGTAGQVVSGGQFFADTLCSLLGGPGAGAPNTTTPQAITAGGQNVSNAINGNPMAAGTIAMAPGSPSGNVALDGVNGTIAFANELFAILNACGCAGSNSPTTATPSSVIANANNTAAAVNANPMASGVLALGQNPSSGNVALDAINGVLAFANELFAILSLCGCAPSNSPTTATPSSAVAAAQATSDAVASHKFAHDVLTGGTSGNFAVDAIGAGQNLTDQAHTAARGVLTTGHSIGDVITAGAAAININTANHIGHQSLTPPTAISLIDQNLLVTDDFSSPNSVVADPNGHWSWDGTDGDPSTNTLGCLKCVVDGTQDDYVSNEIPIVAGETIELAATCKWSGLVYTGASPLIIGVEKYRLMKDPSGNSVYADIGTYLPTGASIPTPGASSNGAWVGVAGIYIGEPGVDQIRIVCRVAPNATAGTVKFDNCDFLKTDLIPDGAVPGVGTTVDSIVTNLYGTAGSGFTHNDAALALANMATNVTSLSAKVTALSAEGHTGSIAGDSFNFTGPILSNANWGGFYHNPGFGDYEGNGNGVGWVTVTTLPANSDGVLGYFDWQGSNPTSTTDYQLIQLVLDGAMGANKNHLAYSTISLFGRIASGFGSYVQLSVSANGQWSIIYQATGGSPTQLATGTCTVPAAGSTISLYCGDKPTTRPRHFRAEIGATIIADIDDTGAVTPMGTSNRGYGWGGAAAYWKFFGNHYSAPPPVNQWLGMDQ